MKRKQEVHILEYGALLSIFLIAVYVSSLDVTGFFAASEYAYSKEVNATSTEKKISEKLRFGNYSPSSCADGIYVETKGGAMVNFTLKNEKYKAGLCTKATVEFNNIIYSKADKKKNATSITYVIYYGKSDGAPANDTEDDADEAGGEDIEEEPENAPPQFLKNIRNVEMEFNSSYTLNLSEYFHDNDTLSFNASSNENMSISLSGYIASFLPLSYPYNRTHQMNATDGEYTTSSNIFGLYAKPPPAAQIGQNETNGTNESISVQISLAYPKNNSVLLEGNHTFVYEASNGTCSVRLRNQTAQNETYLEKGYYWWGVSCEHMNMTFHSGRNYFVVMSPALAVNYSNVADLANATNITLQNSAGRLVFEEGIDLTAVQEMEKYINISRNRVEIDTQSMQHLNKSAVLTLYGVTAASPVIKQNGQPCPADICQIISYADGTLVFRVKHFTVYEVGDAPAQSPEPQPSGGGGGSSGGSGNFVPSGSSFGGPVIITKKSNISQAQNTAAVNRTNQTAKTQPEKQEPDVSEAQSEPVHYVPPAERRNENIITGGIINIFRENFMYIALLFAATGGGYIFLRRGKKMGKKRRRKK